MSAPTSIKLWANLTLQSSGFGKYSLPQWREIISQLTWSLYFLTVEMIWLGSNLGLVIKSKPKSKSQKSIITGMVIFDGPSSRYKELVSDKEKDKDNGNLNVFVLKDGKWVPGEAEDKRDLESSIIDEYDIPDELNNNVGFIGFDKNQQDMVFKIKDTVNKRSTGFQCNQAGREKKHQKEKGIIYILNELEAHKLKRVEGEREEEEPVGPRFSNESTDSVTELCIRIEMTLRIYQKEKLDDKIWFLDTAKAIFNEFEKREKPVKK